MKISIIVPVYNVEPYVEACLQSVAKQTMAEGVECILVDDCGTDKSMQLAEQYIENYQGNITFSILRHDHNRGLSVARNTGIRAAQGEYVYFLDSDDRITPTCLADFMRIIEKHPGVDLIQGLLDQDSPYMKQFLQKDLPVYTENGKYIKRALLDYDELPVCAANKMVRRKLIMDNDIFFKEGIIHEDNHWSFFLAKYVRSLAVYKEQCYLYTENENSIMRAVNREKEIYSYQTMIKDFCENIDDYQRGAQRQCIYLLVDTMLRSKYYHTVEDKRCLFLRFCSVCNPIERGLLKIWYQTPINSRRKIWLHRFLLFFFKM